MNYLNLKKHPRTPLHTFSSGVLLLESKHRGNLSICLLGQLPLFCYVLCFLSLFLTALLAFGFLSVLHDVLMPVLRDLSSGVFTLSYLWLVPCRFFFNLITLGLFIAAQWQPIIGRRTTYQQLAIPLNLHELLILYKSSSFHGSVLTGTHNCVSSKAAMPWHAQESALYTLPLLFSGSYIFLTLFSTTFSEPWRLYIVTTHNQVFNSHLFSIGQPFVNLSPATSAKSFSDQN